MYLINTALLSSGEITADFWVILFGGSPLLICHPYYEPQVWFMIIIAVAISFITYRHHCFTDITITASSPEGLSCHVCISSHITPRVYHSINCGWRCIKQYSGTVQVEIPYQSDKRLLKCHL